MEINKIQLSYQKWLMGYQGQAHKKTDHKEADITQNWKIFSEANTQKCLKWIFNIDNLF